MGVEVCMRLCRTGRIKCEGEGNADRLFIPPLSALQYNNLSLNLDLLVQIHKIILQLDRCLFLIKLHVPSRPEVT